MINVKELRKGSFVNYTPLPNDPPEVIIIEEIRHTEVRFSNERGNKQGACPYVCLDGIPLTSEWLEKLGFEKKMFTYPGDPKTEAVEAFIKGKFVIRWIDIGTYASFRTEHIPYYQSINSVPGDMLFVHQLQNNYYCWTNGEELAIKEPV